MSDIRVNASIVNRNELLLANAGNGALSPETAHAAETFRPLGSYGIAMPDGSVRQVWFGSVIEKNVASVSRAAIRVGPNLWSPDTKTVLLPIDISPSQRNKVIAYVRELQRRKKINLQNAPSISTSAIRGESKEDRALRSMRSIFDQFTAGKISAKRAEALIREIEKSTFNQEGVAFGIFSPETAITLRRLRGDIGTAMAEVREDGKNKVNQLARALSINYPQTDSRLKETFNSVKAAFERSHQGRDWNLSDRDRFLTLVKDFNALNQKKTLAGSLPETIRVPSALFYDEYGGKKYVAVSTTVDQAGRKREWMTVDNLSVWLRNRGYKNSWSDLRALNQDKIHIVGGKHAVEVGQTIHLTHAYSARLKEELKPRVPTQISFTPSKSVAVVGGTTRIFPSNKLFIGGAFLLVPPSDPSETKLYAAAGPIVSNFLDKISPGNFGEWVGGQAAELLKLAQTKFPDLYADIQVLATAAVKLASKKFKLGATAAYPVMVILIKQFQQALERGDKKAALAAIEVGLGGSTISNLPDPGGLVFFYNARANLQELRSNPNDLKKLSFNAGFYANVVGWLLDGFSKTPVTPGGGISRGVTKAPSFFAKLMAKLPKEAAQKIAAYFSKAGLATGTKGQVGWGARLETTTGFNSLEKLHVTVEGKLYKIDLSKSVEEEGNDLLALVGALMASSIEKLAIPSSKR